MNAAQKLVAFLQGRPRIQAVAGCMIGSNVSIALHTFRINYTRWKISCWINWNLLFEQFSIGFWDYSPSVNADDLTFAHVFPDVKTEAGNGPAFGMEDFLIDTSGNLKMRLAYFRGWPWKGLSKIWRGRATYSGSEKRTVALLWRIVVGKIWENIWRNDSLQNRMY